ncbi:MAG: MmgE/PrpD family protein [Betaproteobacteria bacterium]|nr:MmgE/PrpD family protein [Betaproteobacteria bacterium]
MKSIDPARGATAQFGEWASSLRFESIPKEVIDHTKLCLLDGLGCALYGSTQPWGRIAVNAAIELSSGGRATLWGHNATAGVGDAALVNGTATHGFEIDDIHVRSLMHPGAVTIPAALALAETRGRSGRQLLTAIVAGYEIGLRTGICAGIPHCMRGFHPTGTAGSPGAAAAAANLLELTPEQSTHAIAIAATQAAGLYSAVRTGAMTKRMHAGRAAQSGVIAAIMAERGFTGSPDALEASYGGFMSTLSEGQDLMPFVASLGKEWETAQTGFKAYAACASAHTIIDALDAMMKRGLTRDNLEHLTIGMSKIGVNNVGWEYRPTSVVGAQMNGYFTAAVKLHDGEAFIDQYSEERIADGAVLGLIPKIEIRHDPELDAGGAAMRHAVKAHARLLDGRTWEQYVEQRRGSPHHPLSRTELETKFRRTAASALERSAVERLLSAVFDLDSHNDLRTLTALLKPAAPTLATDTIRH